MVSKASEDLPEPDRPVITTSRSRGRSRSTFFRLCSRAPRIEMKRCGSAEGKRAGRRDWAIGTENKRSAGSPHMAINPQPEESLCHEAVMPGLLAVLACGRLAGH